MILFIFLFRNLNKFIRNKNRKIQTVTLVYVFHLQALTSFKSKFKINVTKNFNQANLLISSDIRLAEAFQL